MHDNAVVEQCVQKLYSNLTLDGLRILQILHVVRNTPLKQTVRLTILFDVV
jgi:hypothetical protein